LGEFTEKSAKSQVITFPEVGVLGAAPQVVHVKNPSVLYLTSNLLGAELLPWRQNERLVRFNP
jgi:hypothetical protein